MKVMFCGGGTAGHLTPAVAIAESLLNQNKDTDILFVCREGGEENQTVTKKGYKIETINIHGIERKINFNNVKNFFTALKALEKAKGIIKQYSPNVVIGTGGYVCWPVLRAAQKMNIPTVIHESNACPGLVTKLLSSKCDKVLLNLKGSEKEFKRQDNIKIVGNPVRDEFLNLDKLSARKKLGISQNEFLISSFGGSGGSERINEAVISLMKTHSSKTKNIRHIHSCGNKYYDKIKNQHPEFITGKNGCIIKPYIYDTPSVIVASDIIISRCGAMTIAEISASGCASILIPSPNVTNNHQYKNAKLISDAKAGIMIEESELNDRILLDTVRRLESNATLRESLCKKIKQLYIKESKSLIVNEIMTLV